MTVDFVARLVGSKSGQAKLQMARNDRHVDLGFIFEAFGGEVPDRLKLTLGSI